MWKVLFSNLIPKDTVNHFHFCMEFPLAVRLCVISQGIHISISKMTLARMVNMIFHCSSWILAYDSKNNFLKLINFIIAPVIYSFFLNWDCALKKVLLGVLNYQLRYNYIIPKIKKWTLSTCEWYVMYMYFANKKWLCSSQWQNLLYF